MGANSSAAKVRGADILAKALEIAGVQNIYTLSGNHIMPIFDAAIDSPLRLFHVRHEAAAVHMADAAARLTGNVAVAMVTGGPGHANAVSAMYTALQAESPVLLLSGHAPLNQLGKGAFQEMDQATVAAPCVKASLVARSTATLAVDIANAIRIARSGRPGPVALSLPQDVLDGTLDQADVPVSPKDFQPVPIVPAAESLSNLLSKIAQAKKPLVLTGSHLMQPAHQSAVAACRTKLGIPIIGMESPRGINDPALGAFPGLLAESDLVVLVGKKIDFTLKFGDPSIFSAQARFVVVDAEEKVLAHAKTVLGNRLLAAIHADGPSLMSAIQSASVTANSAHADWTALAKKTIDFEPANWADLANAATDPMHAIALLKPFAEIAKTREVILVADGGEFGQWAQAIIKAPIRVVNGPAGAIGGATPFAIGAAIERPDALVLAFMGDGAFGFHPSEFDTAVRYGVKMVCVVGNDCCWNAEYQIQLRTYGEARLSGCELLPVEYQKVAQAFGAEGVSVKTPAEAQAAAKAALAAKGPFCINGFISKSAAPAVKMV
ncbi:thiamine pyrophosphate-binding protein [beta proteobacterium MWH-UniP1]